MKVKELIEQLSKLDQDMNVLIEDDMDGDDFIVKVDIDHVYVGDGFDDSGIEGIDENETYCIIKSLK